MRVEPISEQDADAQSANVWPDGEYDFEVREAEEKRSSQGSDMFALQLWIFDPDGNRKNIFDYLVNTPKAAWKIRHFAASCGLLPQYEKGDLIEGEIIGRQGRCSVGTQPAKDGYPAKNVIRGYVKSASQPRQAAAAAPRERQKVSTANDLDDDIPF